MTDNEIKHMVDRFLGWTLPENFSPDGGVSFRRLENRHHHPEASPFYPMPSGTNLLDATQADAMVRHMIEGMPRQLMTDAERLNRIRKIIDDVDHRCLAADGPVTPTLEEITLEEMRLIYALARGETDKEFRQ